MSTIPMTIRPFQLADEPAVITLWGRCNLIRAWNDPQRDIQRKLNVQPELFLVGEIDSTIVASVMAGYEGHRGWINYLAVAPEHQHKGLGQMILAAAERRLRDIGCPKINLLIRSSNIGVADFYQRLGYTPDEAVCLGKRLEHDDRKT